MPIRQRKRPGNYCYIGNKVKLEIEIRDRWFIMATKYLKKHYILAIFHEFLELTHCLDPLFCRLTL